MNPYLITFLISVLVGAGLTAFKWYLDAVKNPSLTLPEEFDTLKSQVAHLKKLVPDIRTTAEEAKRTADKALEDGITDRDRLNGKLSGLSRVMKKVEADAYARQFLNSIEEDEQEEADPDPQMQMFSAPDTFNGRRIY